MTKTRLGSLLGDSYGGWSCQMLSVQACPAISGQEISVESSADEFTKSV